MRLDRLIDDLHQLSMADLGTLSYRPQRLDMAVLVRASCHGFEPIAREAGLALEQDLSPAFAQVDAGRMRQLIDNLIGNSLRYSDRGGRVRVSTSIHARTFDLVVDDTPPAWRQRTGSGHRATHRCGAQWNL